MFFFNIFTNYGNKWRKMVTHCCYANLSSFHNIFVLWENYCAVHFRCTYLIFKTFDNLILIDFDNLNARNLLKIKVFMFNIYICNQLQLLDIFLMKNPKPSFTEIFVFQFIIKLFFVT